MRTSRLLNQLSFISQPAAALAINGIALLFSTSAAMIISMIVRLPFSNPYGLAGPVVNLQFNPHTNTLRFLVFLIGSVIGFYIIKPFIAKHFSLAVRVYTTSALLLSLFLSFCSDYLRNYSQIDMFHIGERVSPGSAMYFFGQKPFTNIFFLHGALNDALTSFFAFKIFSPNIGSFFLLDYLIGIVAFSLLLLVLNLLIKNNFIFGLIAVFFMGSLPLRDVQRDLFVLSYLLLIIFFVRNKLSEKTLFTLTSLVSVLSLYHSIDRGIYLILTHGYFLTAYILSTTWLNHKKNFKPIFLFKQALALLNPNILGAGSALLLGIVIFSWQGFVEFLKITFFYIPQMSPLMFDYVYPKPSLATFSLYWLPILLIIINVIVTIELFRKLNKKNLRETMLQSVVVVLGLLFYKSALGRSDFGHVQYAVPFTFMAVFVFCDFFWQRTRILFRPLLIGICLLLFSLPFFRYEQILPWRPTSWHDIKIFFSLPTIADDYWLTAETKLVRDYIVGNTKETDFVFVFSNEVLYYHLLHRPSPTRFYITWFAEPNFFHQEALADLAAHRPKYIIYSSALWTNEIDLIPNTKRLAAINDWILANYDFDKQIGNTVILTPRQSK